MSITPLTPSFGFGVTPGFGINPAYGVSATPPRTEVDLSTPQDGITSFGQMLAQRIDALGPAASSPQVVSTTAAGNTFGVNTVGGVNATNAVNAVDSLGTVGGINAANSLGAQAVNGVNTFDATSFVTAPEGSARTAGSGLGDMVGQGLGKLSALHARSDALATAAATGDLKDIHEYTIAANEAGIATQLAVNVRDKALQAFNDIIRMQL